MRTEISLGASASASSTAAPSTKESTSIVVDLCDPDEDGTAVSVVEAPPLEPRAVEAYTCPHGRLDLGMATKVKVNDCRSYAFTHFNRAVDH